MPTCAAPDRVAVVVAVAAAILAVLPVTAWAGEGAAPPGADACSGCHPPSAADGAPPPLAGRPAEDIAAAMAAFRGGRRPATVMDRIARGFTDEESRVIAVWVAGAR